MKKNSLLLLVIVFIFANLMGANAFALEDRYAENPVLRFAYGESELPEFDLIKPSDFFPAMNYVINEENRIVDSIIANPEEPDFENTIEVLHTLQKTKAINDLLLSLYMADTDDFISTAYKEVTPLVSQHSKEISFNKELFEKITYVFENENRENLTKQQELILNKIYYSGVKNGINLPVEVQNRIKEIGRELDENSYKFSSNLLASENNSFVHVKDKKRLSGISEDILTVAAKVAKEKDLDGWLFRVNDFIYSEILGNADNRELRKEMYDKNIKIASDSTEYNNIPIVKEMVNLRLELANIFDFSNFADFRLVENMLHSKKEVKLLIDSLTEEVYEHAKKETEIIKGYAKSKGFVEELKSYDYSYYSKKYREENFNFDENVIKPYLELNQVKEGIFDLYGSLYGLSFVENNDIQTYHPDLELYKVRDNHNTLIGYLYLDFFTRDSKSSGAWCMELRAAGSEKGEEILPIAHVVTNFGEPNSEGVSLLSHYDLETLLHETGHALHVLLSDVNYQSLTGFSAPWDFVELPSSIMENWSYEKEFLDTFALHYQTGDKIPTELVEKLNEQRKVLNAGKFLAYLRGAYLDFSLHSIEENLNSDLREFERNALKDMRTLPVSDEAVFSPSFGHLFYGGYAANYYSYIWAWVMEADMFSEFIEEGIMSREAGDKFRNMILSKGATEDVNKMYFEFMGSEPSIDALLERNGWE